MVATCAPCCVLPLCHVTWLCPPSLTLGPWALLWPHGRLENMMQVEAWRALCNWVCSLLLHCMWPREECVLVSLPEGERHVEQSQVARVIPAEATLDQPAAAEPQACGRAQPRSAEPLRQSATDCGCVKAHPDRQSPRQVEGVLRSHD